MLAIVRLLFIFCLCNAIPLNYGGLSFDTLVKEMEDENAKELDEQLHKIYEKTDLNPAEKIGEITEIFKEKNSRDPSRFAGGLMITYTAVDLSKSNDQRIEEIKQIMAKIDKRMGSEEWGTLAASVMNNFENILTEVDTYLGSEETNEMILQFRKVVLTKRGFKGTEQDRGLMIAVIIAHYMNRAGEFKKQQEIVMAHASAV